MIPYKTRKWCRRGGCLQHWSDATAMWEQAEHRTRDKVVKAVIPRHYQANRQITIYISLQQSVFMQTFISSVFNHMKVQCLRSLPGTQGTLPGLVQFRRLRFLWDYIFYFPQFNRQIFVTFLLTYRVKVKWSCDSESTRWQLSVASMLEQHHQHGNYPSVISGINQNKMITELNAILATLFSRYSTYSSK